MQRIAFDLDETLGTPIVSSTEVEGFNFRTGCEDLLEELQRSYNLILWTASTRRYLDKILQFGLNHFFQETYSWDELSGWNWKDIRQINADYLIDDSPEYQQKAELFGLQDQYIVVPAYGSPDDQQDPFLWLALIRNRLAKRSQRI